MSDEAWEQYVAGIRASLGYLGKMPSSSIAEHFADEGITGRMSDPCGCPVAVYLEREVKRKVWVEAKRVLPIIRYIPDYESEVAEGQDIYLPESVLNFVHEFDCGDYPALLAWGPAND